MSNEDAPGRELFEWLPYLEDALNPFPQVALVLSSSWCVWPGYGRTLKRFPRGLRERFIGGTFHKRIHGADPSAMESFRATPRGMQIWADVQRRMPLQWLALDDDAEGWPDCARSNLVACDGATGLSCLRVQVELREALRLRVQLADETSASRISKGEGEM